MFAQSESYSTYMDNFFEKHPTTSLSWINDLGKKCYESAAEALLAESQRASTLEVKHVRNMSHLKVLRNFYRVHVSFHSYNSALGS